MNKKAGESRANSCFHIVNVISFWRKVGDSNPRYGNPYVSLANWWFQPLTQPSLYIGLVSVTKTCFSLKSE